MWASPLLFSIQILGSFCTTRSFMSNQKMYLNSLKCSSRYSWHTLIRALKKASQGEGKSTNSKPALVSISLVYGWMSQTSMIFLPENPLLFMLSKYASTPPGLLRSH